MPIFIEKVAHWQKRKNIKSNKCGRGKFNNDSSDSSFRIAEWSFVGASHNMVAQCSRYLPFSNDVLNIIKVMVKKSLQKSL